MATHRFPVPGPDRNKESLSVRGVTHRSPTPYQPPAIAERKNKRTELRHENRPVARVKGRGGLVIRREEFRSHLIGNEDLLTGMLNGGQQVKGERTHGA